MEVRLADNQFSSFYRGKIGGGKDNSYQTTNQDYFNLLINQNNLKLSQNYSHGKFDHALLVEVYARLLSRKARPRFTR